MPKEEPVTGRRRARHIVNRRAVIAGTVAQVALTRATLTGSTLAGLTLPSPTRQLHAATEEIRFGLTPVMLTSDLELLSTLQRYLETATGHPVRLVTKRTYQEITALLVTGQLDAAWICGYPFIRYADRLSLVAVPVWQGQPLYRAYLIVGKDRAVAGADALAGDIHAFSDPDSNSGFLVTEALIVALGHDPRSFFSRTFFTYGHRNVVRAVASGLAQSGSVDGYVWEVLAQVEPAMTARTRVLRRSELLGFPPVATARAAADLPRVAAVRNALLDMAGDPTGRAVLNALRLDGFTRGSASLFDGIARKYASVRDLV